MERGRDEWNMLECSLYVETWGEELNGTHCYIAVLRLALEAAAF